MNELMVREYLGNRIEFKMIDGHVYANANQWQMDLVEVKN